MDDGDDGWSGVATVRHLATLTVMVCSHTNVAVPAWRCSIHGTICYYFSFPAYRREVPHAFCAAHAKGPPREIWSRSEEGLRRCSRRRERAIPRGIWLPSESRPGPRSLLGQECRSA